MIKLKTALNEKVLPKNEIAITRPAVNPNLTTRDSPEWSCGQYLCTVKNDEEGKQQLEVLRKIFSLEYKMRVRGRHHNRKEVLGAKYRKGQQNDIPLEQSEFLAVYLYPKTR